MADDLQKYVELIAGNDPGRPLESAGPNSTQLFNYLGDVSLARSLIANSFWQAYLYSAALYRAASDLNINPQLVMSGEKMVVHRPNIQRFDLLCFVATTGDPRVTRAFATPPELTQGTFNFYRQLGQAPRNRALANPMFAVEAGDNGGPFALIVAPPPSTTLTKPPSPCCDITAAANMSTAGVVAQDIHGRIGVTAAYHGVLGAAQVTVGGVPGTVVNTDVVTDSCFVEVGPPPMGIAGSKGPMRNLLPRSQQAATFEGVQSGVQNTNITALSPELPYVLSNTQGKVYTLLCTDPGDSGAALITDDDYIVGFAFERSGITNVVTYSSWIWADSVYQALSLV